MEFSDRKWEKRCLQAEERIIGSGGSQLRKDFMEFSDRKWEKRCLQAEERIKDLEKQNNELLIQQNDLKTDVNM